MQCILFTTMIKFISVKGENSISVLLSSTANVSALSALINTGTKLKP